MSTSRDCRPPRGCPCRPLCLRGSRLRTATRWRSGVSGGSGSTAAHGSSLACGSSGLNIDGCKHPSPEHKPFSPGCTGHCTICGTRRAILNHAYHRWYSAQYNQARRVCARGWDVCNRQYPCVQKGECFCIETRTGY